MFLYHVETNEKWGLRTYTSNQQSVTWHAGNQYFTALSHLLTA